MPLDIVIFLHKLCTDWRRIIFLMLSKLTLYTEMAKPFLKTCDKINDKMKTKTNKQKTKKRKTKNSRTVMQVKYLNYEMFFFFPK